MLAGENPVRADLAEGLQHEAALRETRVGQDKTWMIHGKVIRIEHIQIDRPGRVPAESAVPAQKGLDLEQTVQQIERDDVFLPFEGRVKELLRAFRAIDRSGPEDGGAGDDAAGGRSVLQAPHGFPQVLEAIAQVRAEGDAETHKKEGYDSGSHEATKI